MSSNQAFHTNKLFCIHNNIISLLIIYFICRRTCFKHYITYTIVLENINLFLEYIL